MTKSLSTSSMVSSASGKKCKKPCQSSSSSSCCTEQCIDCCTSQYQRLSLVRNMVAAAQVVGDWSVNAGQKNRCGGDIKNPNTATDNTVTAIVGAYANEVGCSANGDLALPESFSQDDGIAVTGYEVANLTYQFVNQLAYGPYEPGCHNDQVMGWFVNLQSGELQLYTEMDGVPTNATRACLSANITPSSTQKKQLKLLNKLYKLSKSAVKEVNGIPSQEGNIVEVCDCKGERWLLYIDTASSQDGSPLSECNYRFAIVATKLC